MTMTPILTFRRGGLEVPVVPSDVLAVAFVPGTDADTVQEVVAAVSIEKGVELTTGRQELGLREGYTHRVLMLPGSDEADIAQAFLRRAEVQWAGPTVVDPDSSPLTYLTHEMWLRIEASTSTPQVLERARELGYEVLRRVPYAFNGAGAFNGSGAFDGSGASNGYGETYHLRAQVHPGWRLLADAQRLMEFDGVLAEPNLGATAEPLSETTGSGARAGAGSTGSSTGGSTGGSTGDPLWDRRQIRAREARDKLQQAAGQGKASPARLAVIDGSLDASHPHLPDYQRINFRHFSGGEEAAHLFKGGSRGHGMRVAGVAAAQGPAPGVAAGYPVLGLIYPATEADVLDMYVWAAGLDPWSPRPGFPKPLSAKAGGEPAAVMVTSVVFGFAWGLPMSSLAASAFDHIARRGRGGLGSLAFFAAGNGGTHMPYQCPWAAHPANFGIAASTLEVDGREVRATYSNYQQVELCAPSSATLASNPGGLQRKTRTITSADRRSDRSQAASSTAPAVPASRDEGDDFGGTSSAAPLAAGVAVLALQARPRSRHGEVRALLRGSAVRIDAGAQDQVGRWRSSDGAAVDKVPSSGKRSKTPLSSWGYGFGRVDALQAVTDALAVKPGSSRLLVDPLATAERAAGWMSPSSRGGRRTSNSRPHRTRSTFVWRRTSALLALYHLAFAIFLWLWLWPTDDAYRLAGVSTLLAVYHLLVVLVWQARVGHKHSDVPSEEDPRLMSPDPRTQSGGG